MGPMTASTHPDPVGDSDWPVRLTAMMQARAERKQREAAIRAALGTRRRIAKAQAHTARLAPAPMVRRYATSKRRAG
jgi:hypothetical protein